jgi:hypothetical protein
MRTLIQINQRQSFDSAVFLLFVIPEGNLLFAFVASNAVPY